ncbi:MAG TPA: hypothetical protein DC049_17645 [Spirochaetia bacterium]|nr:hypothetical protein [Spirochaetia bacterium]
MPKGSAAVFNKIRQLLTDKMTYFRLTNISNKTIVNNGTEYLRKFKQTIKYLLLGNNDYSCNII